MAHTNLSHRRTHNLLLISKLLNQRDHVSPFTLVLDSLEAPAKPLIREYTRRANLSKTHTIFLSFTTVSKPLGVDTFVSCFNKTPVQISQAITAATAAMSTKRVLILVDTLHPLCVLSHDSRSNLNLTAYLSSLLAPPRASSSSPPQLSMVAVYHADIPLPLAIPSQAYQPSPLDLLSYLATTILIVHSLPILLSSKLASERSQVAPHFGVEEEKEGILIGLKPTKFSKGLVLKPDEKGIVLELEHRRKSGRGVKEWYFLPSHASKPNSNTTKDGQVFKETVTLLDDHALFRKSSEDDFISEQELNGMTFELGLTDRQRQEREGVVLPYFDAQKEGGYGGPGEGGRILYDMGVEDDFDEEEDEI